jgi:two-component system nitrogen regulation response regulator GlnG
MSSVLIIDDEPSLCWSLAETLRESGHLVQIAGSVEQARQRLDSGAFQPDVIALDVRLPGIDGLAALADWKRTHPRLPIIIMTAFGDLPTAARAFAEGAFEYLVKPFDLHAFTAVIHRALQHETPANPPVFEHNNSELAGRSAAMQAVYRQLALVAPTPYPVLLLGETGTGKELAARAIHQHSRCAAGPFVTVCPAALNPALIESELFGHVRGAFTGAQDSRPGLFDTAAGGTLFLDEIADTPLNVQVKLLRVLETRRFSPVGSGEERSTTARFLAATHRNLPEMIANGTFREDLFHRLSAFTVRLPPLRERHGDIPLLVEQLIHNAAPSLQPAGIADDFLAELHHRQWTGNVRELRNTIDHALVMARGRMLRAEHLPTPTQSPVHASPPHDHSTPPDQLLANAIAAWVDAKLNPETDRDSQTGLYALALQQLDAALLPAVLQHAKDNRSAAARILGLDRATLRSRLRNLTGNDPGDDDAPANPQL